ncbi:hypothetical protein AWC38_SpisGene6088 [Stylophora pistillata]|uniref:Uncharacterized protein n=1 Tax=Stylophora pistillata TaxID=50429 RepID=A0A2B4SL01_STYPI|nr:hypothetical protein AWC38_SpisGene6088 [Stylophora pistillata]
MKTIHRVTILYIVTDKTDPEATAPDYISLANDLIPGHCVQISQDSGQRINGILARKAGEVKSTYKKARNSRERGELHQKKYKLSIFKDEIVSLEGVEEELICTRQDIEEWKRKVEDLEQKKTELVEALQEALRVKDECLNEKEKDIAKLTEQNQELQRHINALEGRLGEVGCTGKKLGELGLKQRSRRLKELKSRAQVALWFMGSYGLELTCLKGVDQKHGKTYTNDLEHRETLVAGSETEDDDKVEQVLYLLDEFCASDELYHELTIMCDELPKSYLIKQKTKAAQRHLHK